MDWQTVVMEPIRQALGIFLGFIPNILGALLILFVGWLFAKAVEALVVRGLQAIRLDRLAEQVWLADALAKGGVKRTTSELIGALIYWLLILIVLISVLNALQLMIAADLISRVVSYLPNVVAAVFILVLGIFAAAFLGATVRTSASNMGVAPSSFLSQITQTIVIVFVSVAALQQLGIQFVGEVFLIVLSGICLGLALAFGLGCQHLAGKWMDSVVEQFKAKKQR